MGNAVLIAAYIIISISSVAAVLQSKRLVTGKQFTRGDVLFAIAMHVGAVGAFHLFA